MVAGSLFIFRYINVCLCYLGNFYFYLIAGRKETT